jgi:mRNA interferase MazF
MKKDFDGWNREKKILDEEGNPQFCRPREIWWCKFGVNVGHEQDGSGPDYLRPVAVIRGFNERTFWGVALTGRKREERYYFPIGIVGDREASVNLSQIRIFDTKRLVNKMEVIDDAIFQKLKSALYRTLFG